MSKKTILADPFPENHDPGGKWFRQLRFTKKQVGLTSYKVLLSKLLFTQEIFTEEDEALLFLSYEKVVELCTDPAFQKRWFFLIFINRIIFNDLPGFVKSPLAIETHRKQLESVFSHKRSELNAQVFYGMKLKLEIRLEAREPQKTKSQKPHWCWLPG